MSRLDQLIAALEPAGFERVDPARPLFVCGAGANGRSARELAGLSYLATDLSYRFSAMTGVQ